ncbi:MAG: GuaB3 family IMP dehydrogenase-related protein [Stackebrandtia sp.]
MRDVVEIGGGKTARRGYGLEDVSLVPSRRTRDVDDVSVSWQLDAYRLDLPCMAHPSDAIMSPESATELGKQGGLGVLNAEGLWTRYEDPRPLLAELAAVEGYPADMTPRLQRMYAEPVKPELIAERVKEMREAGGPIALRVSPQHTVALAPVILDAGVDVLVIQGTIVSAEHVSTNDEPLNLKEFIADLDLPVVVGGCTNYQTALHLMRTGAAGVIVGVGANLFATTGFVLGIEVPMASAIADAAAARSDYLDETEGRYVHLIADGDMDSSGEIAKAIACGADAVMLGEPLANCAESPAGGAWWHSAASHPKLPRGVFEPSGDMAEDPEERVSMEVLLHGPSGDPNGTQNLFGGLRRAMAKCGYSNVKEFQKAELVLS